MAGWKGIVGQGFTLPAFRTYVDTVAFDTWRPSFVVLHNTALPTRAQWPSVPGAVRMRNLEAYYRDTMQWSAGPHLFVADDQIWVFTPLNTPGVHSPSWNSVSWGVEMVGDYETESFDDPLRFNAIGALATLHSAMGLDPSALRLHKEDPLTTHHCPGKNVVKADVIDAVHAAMISLAPGEHEPGSSA
jgi:hypothetical protein